MRRPLFGTGFPQSTAIVADPVTNPDDCLQVMDLRSLNAQEQSYTRFLTLFARMITAATQVDVYMQVGSSTPFIVASMYATDSEIATDPSSCTFEVRGNVRVFVASVAVIGATLGYYELETDQPTLTVPRPLQPTDPVSPFTVIPTVVPTSDSVVIHAFDEDYVDLVTINYSIDSAGESVSTIDFPNGVVILVPPEDNVALAQRTIIPGIPMLPSAANQTIEASTDAIAAFIVSGTFSRGG